jgi:hypothetical protein
VSRRSADDPDPEPSPESVSPREFGEAPRLVSGVTVDRVGVPAGRDGRTDGLGCRLALRQGRAGGVQADEVPDIAGLAEGDVQTGASESVKDTRPPTQLREGLIVTAKRRKPELNTLHPGVGVLGRDGVCMGYRNAVPDRQDRSNGVVLTGAVVAVMTV